MANISDTLYEIFGTDDEAETSFTEYELNNNPNSNLNLENSHGDDMNDSHDEMMQEGDMDDLHDDVFDEMVREGPKSGMSFDSAERLYEAYHSFAKVQGFCAVCRSISSSSKYVVMSCDRGGKLDYKKHTKKTDCHAHINAIRPESGLWEVSTVHLDHNHELDPNMSALMAGHRSLPMRVKRQLEANDIVGVPVSKNVKLVQVQAGGPGNLGATARDCRNFINERRRLRLGEGDADAIRKLFRTLQMQDARFFHLMDIDEDFRLRNVMWIHPRSIAAYQDFHDVVSFDTTYLINQYQMPFATVVGVNHHHQSILLGCALLAHEHAESFKWFFSNWVEAMGGVHPTAILTDQCESIGIAVREVMPNTVHRLCLWHICQKIPQKFKGVADSKKCSKEFYSMIYDSLSIVQFEDMWAEFISHHGQQTNRWLKDLYAERENWAPIYLNHFFWAGMVSTQRSESMHAFFDSYVNSRSTLKTFVEQYEIAVNDKIRKGVEADFQSKIWKFKPASKYMLEGQFAGAYTLKVYKLFQEEINKICNCNVKEVACVGEDDVGGLERFEVLEMSIARNEYHRQYTFIVDYRPIGQYISCNCRKFEFKGILCVHVLKVLVYKDIQHVNERYILRRWRKDVYRPHSSIIFAGGYPHMTAEYKAIQEMERDFQQCIDLAYGSEEKMNVMKERCREMKNALINWSTPAPRPPDFASGRTQERISNETLIGDPKVSRPRGRPKQNRMKSVVERNRSRGNGNIGTQSSRV